MKKLLFISIIAFSCIAQSVCLSAAGREPENPDPQILANGIRYALFDYLQINEVLTNFPDTSSLVYYSSGSSANFDISVSSLTGNDVIDFLGYIDIAQDGTYTFYTTSDDGSLLYIGDTIVVNNDGLHGMTESSGAIELKAGRHFIKVRYFNQLRQRGLEVRYECAANNISKQLIPDSVLYCPKLFDTVNISAVSSSVNEGGLGQYQISRSSDNGDLTVYLTSYGTAAAGADYTVLPSTIVIADGQFSALVSYTVATNNKTDLDKTVVLALKYEGLLYKSTAKSAATTIVDTNKNQFTALSGSIKIIGGKNGYIKPDNSEFAVIICSAKEAGSMSLKIYNMNSEMVWERSENAVQGQNYINWDCRDKSSAIVQSGVYVLVVYGCGINDKNKIAIVR